MPNSYPRDAGSITIFMLYTQLLNTLISELSGLFADAASSEVNA